MTTGVDNRFFEHPILNSPYDYPRQHWELDEQGQPTQQIIDTRRRADSITPIPKPRKVRARGAQAQLRLDTESELTTAEQQYDPTSIINELRRHVDQWRLLPNASDWGVTPETARLLQHWRRPREEWQDVRPFFCQVEAVETLIWLTEVAPKLAAGKKTP